MGEPNSEGESRRFRDKVRPLTALQNGEIYLVKGKDSTDRQAWYYFRVNRTKRALFERATRQGKLNLNDFGCILLSGYGDHPPAYAIQRAYEEFGFKTPGS